MENPQLPSQLRDEERMKNRALPPYVLRRGLPDDARSMRKKTNHMQGGEKEVNILCMFSAKHPKKSDKM